MARSFFGSLPLCVNRSALASLSPLPLPLPLLLLLLLLLAPKASRASQVGQAAELPRV